MLKLELIEHWDLLGDGTPESITREVVAREQAKLTAKQIWLWGNKSCPHGKHEYGRLPAPCLKRECDECWQELEEASK